MNPPSPLRAPSPEVRTSWNPWPVSIIGFFTLAIIGCAGFVLFCARHPAELVAADYYEKEVRYQSRIDSLRRTQLASATYDPASKRITISLPPSHSPAKVSGQIQLYRPSAFEQDRQLKFEPNTNGKQTIDASTLPPGLWKVRVSWTVDQQDYFLDQKVVIETKAS